MDTRIMMEVKQPEINNILKLRNSNWMHADLNEIITKLSDVGWYVAITRCGDCRALQLSDGNIEWCPQCEKGNI